MKKNGRSRKRDKRRKRRRMNERVTVDAVAKDWNQSCSVCGQTPVVVSTGMCGPCTFGEADTAGGEW